MLFQIIFLLCLNSAWASPRNLVGRNYQNQLRIDQDQFIHEIILRHEEDLKHAPRVSVGHDLPVVCNQNVSVRACESAIAHVRAVTSVRKGCEASWNCACEGACVWGYL